MNTENKELMQQAKGSLSGKWGLAIGTMLVYTILTSIGSSPKCKIPIISLLISGPFALGLAYFTLALSRNTDAKFRQIFDGFKDYKRALLTYLLMLWNIFIRLLLLIVPGIIACFAYSMTFFLLADNSSLTPKQALEESKKIMDGNKMKLFHLFLRFLPLVLLCILTLGIGFLWLMPYMQVTIAKFYDDIKN